MAEGERVRTASDERRGAWIFAIVVATNLYCSGAGFVEAFVNYPGWLHIDAESWPQFRATLSTINLVFVIPFFASIIAKIMLVRTRPARVPAWGAWALLATHVYLIIVTATYFVPHFQIPLKDAPNDDLVRELIKADLILREIPGLATLALTFGLLVRALLPRDPTRESPAA